MKTIKMKTIKLICLALFLFASNANYAQVSINVNFGTPPQWGPVGYTAVSYYYLPDVEAYYDIRGSQFIFLSNGVWIRSHSLPYRYRNYDLYNGYKVVLSDYRGVAPYTHYKEHKVKYYRGYNKGHQQTYRTADNYKPHGNDNHSGNTNNGNGNKGNDKKGNGNKGHKNGKH